MTTKRFAVLDENNVVVNVIVAETIDDAIAVTGATVIEETVATRNAFIGEIFNGNVFRHARPFSSWEWSDELLEWVAPLPYPDGGYHEWDENSGSWVSTTYVGTPTNN